MMKGKKGKKENINQNPFSLIFGQGSNTFWESILEKYCFYVFFGHPKNFGNFDLVGPLLRVLGGVTPNYGGGKSSPRHTLPLPCDRFCKANNSKKTLATYPPRPPPVPPPPPLDPLHRPPPWTPLDPPWTPPGPPLDPSSTLYFHSFCSHFFQ